MPPEVQAFLEGLSAFQIIIWGGALVALGVGVYKAWPVLRRFVQTVDALADLPEFMERIRHQVENDHDSNLRDEVTEILELANDTAAKVATVTDQMTDLAAWQVNHEEKSDAAVARIHALEQKEKA